MTYYIIPKEGYTEEDLKMNGPNPDNARIVKFGPMGNIEEEHICYPSNIERYNAKPHPNYLQDIKIHELGGRTITIPTPLEEGYLADNVCPFKQLIYLTVKERGRTVSEDIVNYLIDKRYKPDTKANREWLKRLVEWMCDQGYLRYEMGYIVLGSRKLPIGRDRIPIKEGYDPVLREMALLAERKDIVSRDDFADYMIADIGWIDFDPVLKKTPDEVLNAAIRGLIRRGVIKVIKPNTFKYVKPLEKL